MKFSLVLLLGFACAAVHDDILAVTLKATSPNIVPTSTSSTSVTSTLDPTTTTASSEPTSDPAVVSTTTPNPGSTTAPVVPQSTDGGGGDTPAPTPTGHSDSSSTPPPGPGLPVAAIVGIVIGIATIVIAVGGFIAIRWRQSQAAFDKNEPLSSAGSTGNSRLSLFSSAGLGSMTARRSPSVPAKNTMSTTYSTGEYDSPQRPGDYYTPRPTAVPLGSRNYPQGQSHMFVEPHVYSNGYPPTSYPASGYPPGHQRPEY